MDNDQYIKEETKKTEFNASLAKLQRIDKLKQEIHIARIENDFYKMYDLIVGYMNELWEKLSKEERQYIDKQTNDLFIARADWLKLSNSGRLHKKTSPDYMFELTKVERKLGEFENKYGMGMIDREDDMMGGDDW